MNEWEFKKKPRSSLKDGFSRNVNECLTNQSPKQLSIMVRCGVIEKQP